MQNYLVYVRCNLRQTPQQVKRRMQGRGNLFGLPRFFPCKARNHLLLRRLPKRFGLSQRCSSRVGQAAYLSPPVCGRGLGSHQAVSLQEGKISRQRRSIHSNRVCDLLLSRLPQRCDRRKERELRHAQTRGPQPAVIKLRHAASRTSQVQAEALLHISSRVHETIIALPSTCDETL